MGGNIFIGSGGKMFIEHNSMKESGKPSKHQPVVGPANENGLQVTHSGIEILDQDGNVTVHLPDGLCYAVANERIVGGRLGHRYSLTAIGAPMPFLYIHQMVELINAEKATSKCSFSISGGLGGGQVSWHLITIIKPN